MRRLLLSRFDLGHLRSLRSPRSLVSAALLFAACTGIFFDKGNAFPCDFNAGLGVRDAVCVAGDVCGTDNVCHPYFYEGPRFEGNAKLPVFASEEFATLHPLTLDRPITFLARAATSTPGPLMAGLEDGRFVVSVEKGLRTAPNPPMAQLHDAVFYRGEFGTGSGVEAQVLAGLTPRVPAGFQLAYFSAIDGGPGPSSVSGDAARVLRVTPPANQRFPLLHGVRPQPGMLRPVAGEVVLVGTDLQFGRTFDIDAGAIDVGVLMRGAFAGEPPPLATPPKTEAVILTQNALVVARGDGGFDEFPGGPWEPTSQLRFNGSGTLMAIESVTSPMNSVLSTWQVGLNGAEHTLQLAWPDCTPCKGGLLKRATPLPPADGLGVEVFCIGTPAAGATEIPTSLFRVTGSNAVVPSDACLSEPLTLPIDPRQLSIGNVSNLGIVAAAGQRGVAVGGRHGQVWFGETLSTLLPLTLERVPLDVTVAPVFADGQRSQRLVAITDRYSAVNQPPVAGQLPAGFRRLDEDADFSGKSAVQLFAAIHGTEGWGVLRDGVVVRFALNENVGEKSEVKFGPKLVTSTGEPVERSIGGEMFNGTDGGALSMVIAADDALYFLENPLDALGDQSKDELTPQLQPEPSVPIRSLALERTPLGTGVGRARGYLVTSRNVFEWTFGGSPARWSSRPLAVAGGEPLEVWFDTARSALGRVGYSDGRIFTLPGGYQLALPLPGSSDGTVLSVVDYENFGGWPVALARHGLFIARWDTDESGKLLNKFPDGGVNRPMDWREIVQPDGGRPWARKDKTRGKLFTSSTRIEDGGTEFRLHVFLDDGVFQVGSFVR
ncbi:MAG: hypothetical protein JNM17_39085 [Archangium sp.]|nr:hypothetical protein [Archangium sp.]